MLEKKKVAVSRTQPNGRVLGVDIIPAPPPKGVSTIQGNFLSPNIQAYVQEFLCDPDRGRWRPTNFLTSGSVIEQDLRESEREYGFNGEGPTPLGDTESERTVDVVLSDMSAPWDQTTGFWKRSLSDPYHRMMNTSGINFKDHAGSMVCYVG
jgi:21S rRNA (uridine2791-2'-O)-methyltransferase